MVHILVLEDERDVREVVVAALEVGGHWVVGVGTIGAARAALNQGGIELIVSDSLLGYSEDKGLKIADEARLRKVPLLMMTGSLRVQEEYTSDGTPFVTKPFRGSELRRQVDEAIKRGPAVN